MPKVDLKSLFSSPTGKKIYSDALKVITEYDMDTDIQRGVLVGLSGGADSVMLLCLLAEYRSCFGDFPIVAVHVNHGIRGDEADRDEAAVEAISARVEELYSQLIEVPAYKAFEAAQNEVTELMARVNDTINAQLMDGQPENCTHNCSTCGGCH